MVNHGKTVIAREIEQEKQITEKNDEETALCHQWMISVDDETEGLQQKFTNE